MPYNQQSEQPGGVQLFSNPSFGTICTAGTADNPLFCLKDVCRALGLNTNGVRQRLEKGVISTYPLKTNGGTQHVNFINEDGLYDVIFDSRKAEAKAFRKWVTSEVLPSIRKTGGYGRVAAAASLEESASLLVPRMQELIVKTVEDVIRRYMPAAPACPPPCPQVPKTSHTRAKAQWSLGEIASELDVDSYYLKCLLKSIRVIKVGAGRTDISARTREDQKLFVNLPYEVRLYGGVERFDGIIVTELGRKAILDAFPVYMKQYPYLKY